MHSIESVKIELASQPLRYLVRSSTLLLAHPIDGGDGYQVYRLEPQAKGGRWLEVGGVETLVELTGLLWESGAESIAWFYSTALPGQQQRQLFDRRNRVAMANGVVREFLAPLSAIFPETIERAPRRTPLDINPEGNAKRDLLEGIGRASGPILLEGATGAGKTEAAHIIHASHRPSGPILVINCATLGNNDRETLLRGVEGGYFTDVGQRPAVFETCHGGTLFFDDFQDLPISAQATLLDLIDPFTCEVRGHSLGGRSWEADVQVVVAINQPVDMLLRSGSLRPDILFRIQRHHTLPTLAAGLAPLSPAARERVLRLFLLTMRERGLQLRPSPDGSGSPEGQSDERFADAFGYMCDRDQPFTPRSPAEAAQVAMPIPEAMLEYQWPGNFRELEGLARVHLKSRQVARWTKEEIREAFDTVRRRSAGLGPATEQVAATLANPSRLMAMAWVQALSQAGATRAQAASDLGLDPRTLDLRLREIAAGHDGGVPLARLLPEEVRALRAGAAEMLARPSRRAKYR